MLDDNYFGTYARFETASKKDAAALLGADNLVGDRFSIAFKTDDGVISAWLVNRFGAEIGFFDSSFSRQLSILHARGFQLVALLSFVAYASLPEPGCYWGEAAVIGYSDEIHDAASKFIEEVGLKLQDSVRPDVSLGKQGLEQMVAAGGCWVPKRTLSLPTVDSNTVILKSKRKLSEKVIEQGRRGNIGCYIVSWVFLLALVALLVFALKSCGAI